MLLAFSACGGAAEEPETLDEEAPALQEQTPAPEELFTAADLQNVVLQRADVPAILQRIPIDNETQVEYTVNYELPDPEPTSTGLLSVSSSVRFEARVFPTLSDVRALQRHTLDAVEIPNTGNLGEESVLYRVTVLANKAEHHVYYGYIKRVGLRATLIVFKGTLSDPSPEEVAATLADVLVLMESQAARLFGSDPSAFGNTGPAPTEARVFTRLDLPGFVLQRSDVPASLDLLNTQDDSEVEYIVEYELPDPEASLTGLRSVSSTARIGNLNFPSVADVRSFQRHTQDAVEIRDIGVFGERSVLYRVTALANKAEHQIYYGFIDYGGLSAALIAVQATLPEPSPAEVDATLPGILLLMQSQEARLLASGS